MINILSLPWPLNHAYNLAYKYRDNLPTNIRKFGKGIVEKQRKQNSQLKTLSFSLFDRINQLKLLETGLVVANLNIQKKLPSDLKHKLEEFDTFFSRKKYGDKPFYLLLDTKDKSFFTHVINNLEHVDLHKINFLFFGNYEFAGGSFQAPIGSTELNYTIFNHFSDYHGVNERLLYFKIEYKNNKILNIEKKIISPKVLISGKIVSDNCDEIMVVSHFVINQRLSSRHERWRAQFDVIYKNSVTTNHGCHDFELRNSDVAFYAPELGNSNLEGFVTYPKDIINNGFNRFVETSYKKLTSQKFLAEFFNNTSVKEFGRSLISLENGNSYYYIFTDNKTISSNHLVSRKPEASWPADKYNEAKKLAKEGIIYNIHSLPVLPDKEFELGVFWPEIIDKLDIIFQLYSTKEIKKVSLERDKSTVFPSKLFEIMHDDVILIYPDYSKENLDMAALTGPDMLIRHKKTNDWDMTEFQSSWRNQQFHNELLPHWLGRQKSLNPSCNISGVFNPEIFDKAYLTLVAVPPKIKKILKGEICIKIYLMNGALHKVINKSFVSPIEIIELKNEKNQKYWFNVRCFEVDFTVNLVQITEKGSVSLQHLWGY